MNIQFDILFEVKLLHNYFKSGLLENFLVEPTEQCAKHMRNHGLLLKKTKKGFVVLYEYKEDAQGTAHPLRAIEDDLNFSFMISSSDQLLMNYSDLPLRSGSSDIYRLHNLRLNMQGRELLLTTNEYLSEDDMLELRSQFFNFRFNTMEPHVEVELLDEHGTTQFREQVLSADETVTCSVDVRHLPPGRFELNVDGSRVLEFYASDELVRKKAFCVIDLFKNGSVPQEYRFTDGNNDVQSKTYSVMVNKRSTLWRYLVVLKYAVDENEILPDNLDIAYPDNTCDFDKKTPYVNSGGTNVVPFVSNKKIPLSEEPIAGIVLTKKIQDNNTVTVIDNLQNPSVSSIKPAAPGKIYSEAFVYL